MVAKKKTAKKKTAKKKTAKKKTAKKSFNVKTIQINDDEPWVTLIGASIDKKRGVQVELDWNDAFVQYLKAHGFTTGSDDIIVQKWFAVMNRELIEDMAEDGKGSDFE